MTSPLKVRVAVLEEAQQVIDFLAEHHFDIGSINADRVVVAAPADMRLLCVALADQGALLDLILKMQMHLGARDLDLTNRCAVLPLPLDTLLVVFLDIVAVERPL